MAKNKLSMLYALRNINKINKKIASRILTAFLITLFVWYFLAHIDDFKILLKIHPIFIISLAGIYVGGVVVNGLFIKWSIALFGKYIRFSESVKISLISTAGNFFAPSGSGLAFRAIYLKKRHNLAYNDYIPIVFCNYILAFFVNAIFGLYAMYILRDYNSRGFVILAVFFVILLIISTAAFFIRIKDRSVGYRHKFVGRVFQILVRITNGWRLILGNKKVMFSLFTLTIANTLLIVLSTYFIFSAIGIHLSIASLILFSVIGSLSIFINITPGNLGIRETIYIIFSTVIGLTTAQILSAALIDRVVLFAVIFLLWLVDGRKSYSTMNSNTIL